MKGGEGTQRRPPQLRRRRRMQDGKGGAGVRIVVRGIKLKTPFPDSGLL